MLVCVSLIALGILPIEQDVRLVSSRNDSEAGTLLVTSGIIDVFAICAAEKAENR